VNAWDEAYLRPVAPPWDIGRPQPEFVRLADDGRIGGRVIDVGCGTGENTLMLAARGLEVVGIDIAREAIQRAARKAEERRIRADFIVADALELRDLIATIGAFDTAIDSGVFHTFPDEDRGAYVNGVAAAVRPGGRAFVMAFSEDEPGWGGPRRVTQAELRDWFSNARGWRVESIESVRFGVNEDHPWLRLMGSAGGAKAWLAAMERIANPGESAPQGTEARA
jgi:2-polyprenyl-3-methyl-5-hydroxy-6-metoxy-1,4-benzoquinol methylase